MTGEEIKELATKLFDDNVDEAAGSFHGFDPRPDEVIEKLLIDLVAGQRFDPNKITEGEYEVLYDELVTQYLEHQVASRRGR